MKEFVVSKKEEGQSVLKYLQRTLPEAPNSFFYKMMRKKNITLDGKKIEGNEKIKEGNVVKFFLSDETFDNFSVKVKKSVSINEYMEAYARFGSPEVVYEDEHILIINKPMDMLSQKAKKDDLSANEWLIGYLLYTKKLTKQDLLSFVPSVCNRLDRNTGGLLLFGKSLFGINTLNTMLRERTGDKYYMTVVSGNISDTQRINGYLTKDENANKVTISSEKTDDSDYIETEYVPLQYIEDRDVTILKVLLVTGKPHQIRAHLAYIGHPIIGDMKYGLKSINDKYRKELGISNQVLYCVNVVFPKLPDYPAISGKSVSIDTPVIFKKIKE